MKCQLREKHLEYYSKSTKYHVVLFYRFVIVKSHVRMIYLQNNTNIHAVFSKYHNVVFRKQCYADPTKYREEASNHDYLVLRTILMPGQAYPTIFYALDFSAVEAVVHMWQNAVRRLSASIHTEPNVLASGSFPTPLNILKQLTHQLVMFSSSASVWDLSSSSISSNSLSSKFFGAPERSLSSSLKSLFLKRRNQSLHVRQSIATISLNKNSMCFNCRFVLNKVVQ